MLLVVVFFPVFSELVITKMNKEKKGTSNKILGSDPILKFSEDYLESIQIELNIHVLLTVWW